MKPFSLKEDELDALINRVESSCLKAGDADIIKAMADAVKSLSQAVNDKATSIKKLLKMIFGSKTEKKKSVSKNKKAGSTTQKKKKKGHGKRSADDFTGADKVPVSHETLSHKDPCPLCPNGILYLQKDPGLVIHFTGRTPINATVYETEKLRCNLCGEVFTAQAPENRTGRHYDPSAMAMMSILRYGCGLPCKSPGKYGRSASGFDTVGEDRSSSRPHLSGF